MAAPVASTTTGEIAPDHSTGKSEPPPRKKGRTNTPWTAEEEQRLKTMRDAGRSWSEIAKVRLSPRVPKGVLRNTGTKYDARRIVLFVGALREAIKEYEANKWKTIGQKVGKPAKACEQYAKEHFKDI
ncbi:hypothetical protein FE257_012622 [Aspergillus nanangensis]|uniref:Uncharacterized protein n=1 Tax=Aspergillus nanangensis TaxID=2582783 RepID=A0AAD4CHG6_ASPNN|nr:hypothetical protein FE257_012622 [Aspergillus nanangensis]